MANLWSATSYGFSPIYWLTIAGVDVVFAERATGLGLPAGWTVEDGSLIIDDSAELGVEAIDRERGIGTGLDLTFKLLDTPTVRQWLRRWSKACKLTADLLPGDSTIAVDNNAAWGSADAIFIGTERIEFGARPDDQTFGTLSRGTVGTLVSVHKTGTTGQIVTDVLRNFRGRDVVLWAAFADPSGHICGGTLDGQESIQVWRGRITAAPERATDGFVFSAQSIDRLLDEQLAGKMSGDVLDIAPTVLVNAGWMFSVVIRGMDAAFATQWEFSFALSPFSGLAGTYLAASVLRTTLSTAWDAAVVAAGAGAIAHIGSLQWNQVDGKWHAAVKVLEDAAVYRIETFVSVDGSAMTGTFPSTFSAGMTDDYLTDLNWNKSQPLFCPSDPDGNESPTGVTLKLTEGNAADVPPIGKARITSGSVACTYTYSAKGEQDGAVHLHGLQPMQGETALDAAAFSGATVEVLLGDEGTFDLMALRCLQSSGMSTDGVTPGPRGAFDLLPRGAGYGLSEDIIDVDSFVSMLGQEPTGSLQGKLTAAGSSFTDLFGGVLGLFRMAVVARPSADEYQTPVRLAVVSTDKGTDYVCIITDDDLLSHAGDPVASVKRAPTPNVITVKIKQDGQSGDGDKLIFNDWSAVDAIGKREATYRVDAIDRAELQNAARPAVAGHFAFDETIQTAELHVHPATPCEVGDAVWLTTTHPAVWTFGALPGGPGYDGPARVTGKKLHPTKCVATLTVIIDGSLRQHALSPAALVLGTDSSTAPTWVDVPAKYLKHFAASLNADSSFFLWHYQPGRAEGSAEVLTIDGASLVGGNCRLTVSDIASTIALDTTRNSTLTLPPTAWATTFQKLYAHKSDGSNWG